MGDFLRCYEGRRVFITGDTGFKGAWLAFWLSELGAQVHGYALPPLAHQLLFDHLGLANRIKHTDGDICDFHQLNDVVNACQPEVVFHLAAQSLVRASYENPRETMEVNVSGSVNVLESIRLVDTVKALVYITSDKCYKNHEWVWGYRENDELGGRDPYSASKAAAEIVFSSYRDSFFEAMPTIGVASARAGNVIGGGDWSIDRVVPDTIRALQAGVDVSLRNPQSTRPWQHVLEPLYGYLLLGNQLLQSPKSFSGSWNFGPSVESVRTVADLVSRMISHWGHGHYVTNRQEAAPHEAGLLKLNCDKAQQLLAWQPVWNFDETVKKTIEWYQQTSQKANYVDICKAQIAAYTGSNCS